MMIYEYTCTYICGWCYALIIIINCFSSLSLQRFYEVFNALRFLLHASQFRYQILLRMQN